MIGSQVTAPCRMLGTPGTRTRCWAASPPSPPPGKVLAWRRASWSIAPWGRASECGAPPGSAS
eukprot:1182091-Prorocentrum_minimum.AAC.1